VQDFDMVQKLTTPTNAAILGIFQARKMIELNQPIACISWRVSMINKTRRLLLPFLLFVAVSLGACKLPANYTPTPGQVDEPVYTSAAETIAAQITGIVDLATQTAYSAGAGTAQASAATETLPATSTPMPTKTPQPSDTPQPTDTLEPSPTLPPTEASDDPRANLGEPTWSDNFDTAFNWPLYRDDHVDMQVSDGMLQMTALYADKWDSWMLTRQSPTDFYLELNAYPAVDCGYLDRYGVMVRAPDPNQGYLFGFSCDGQYSFRIWNGEKFYYPVPWDASRHILQGLDQTNRLGIMVKGNKFSLYANGVFLTTVDDDTYTYGEIGVFVGAVKTAGFTAAFDEIAYWELP
jgi:hypothetical protein